MTVERQQSLARQIRDAVENRESQRLPVLLQALELTALESGVIEEDVFESLLQTVSSGTFVRAPQAWLILKFLDDNWEFIDAAQQGRLLPAAGRAFDRFDDWMASFFVADMLGRRYPDRAGLDMLATLSRVPGATPRSLVPNGLAQFVRHAADPELTREATRVLRSMTRDPEADVRNEAEKYVQQLSRDGLARE